MDRYGGNAMVKEEMDIKPNVEDITATMTFPQVASNGQRASNPINVTTNLYPLTLPKDKLVYKYRIELIKITAKKEKEVARGPKQDLPTIMRRRVCFSLFYDLVKAGKIQAQNKYSVVYDAAYGLYSSHPLAEGEVSMNIDECSSKNTKDWLGSTAVSITAKIQSVAQFTIMVGNESVDSNETKQFLDILTSAAMIRNGTHLIYQNKAYSRSTDNNCEKPLSGAKVIKSGAAKSVRRIEDHHGQGFAIQIDPKKSPFFEEINLLDMLMKECEVRSGRELEDKLRRDRRSLKKLSELVKGLWVETTHIPDSKKTYNIAGMHTANARDTTFNIKGEDINVYDYFVEQYHKRLEFPTLPLVVSKTATAKSYHPIEVLMMPRGQRVTTNKATPDMAEKMIKACQMTPVTLIENMNAQKEDFELDNNNKFFKEFGIKIESAPMKTAGKQLSAPAVKYAGNMIQPDRNTGLIDRRAWKTGKYIKPMNMANWKVISFDEVDNRTIQGMIQGLCRQGRMRGMQINERPEILQMSTELPDNIFTLFHESRNKGVTLILGVTKQKLNSVHHVLKRAEALTGVIGQHIAMKTAGDIAANKSMTTDNILAKMNGKLGGINHTVEISQDMDRLAQSCRDFKLKDHLSSVRSNRMFIGISLSHAGAQSYTDRALAMECNIPTVVGMTYSVKNESDFEGFSWYQETRLTSVAKLHGRVSKALTGYFNADNRLPDEIVVYRTGTSEGEFPHVQKEMEQIREAFKMKPGYSPTLTCIVVIAGSNYRIMPDRPQNSGPAFVQNVKPGTCVDTGITNPAISEFILTPHGAIQGTSRPIRCSVIEWTRGRTGDLLELEHLEQLTNMLTYTHQVSTGSVHAPGVLYAAEKVAERGRDQFNFINNNESDMRSMASSGSGGNIKPDGSADFWERLSMEHESKASKQWWS